MNKLLALGLSALIATTASLTVRADDETATNLLTEAKGLYEKRAALGDEIDTALTKLDAALDAADSDEIKFDVNVMKSRCFYWKGAHKTDEESRVTLYWNGVEAAQEAANYGEWAEAGYYEAINLGRWAEAYGIVRAIVFKKAHRKMMNALDRAIAAKTRDGAAGETLDGFGPHRAYGRLWHKLPGIYGGSRTKALEDLEASYKGAPNFVLNVTYYADALFDGGSSEQKAQAKSMLDELLKQDPQTFNTSRTPETIDEFKIAADTRQSMGN